MIPPEVRGEATPRALLLKLASYHGIGRDVARLIADKPDPPELMTLGDTLRATRGIKGLAVQTVHERCGISRTQLAHFENKPGKNPGLRTLQGLAHGYELPFGLLLVLALRDAGLVSAPGAQNDPK